MEKKTSYVEFGSQFNDKNIIVLEFGRHYTRCGFAGEPAPRSIIETCVDDSQGNKTYLDEIQDADKLGSSLGDFIEKIYFSHLAVSPKEKKVVVVESVFCKSLFRNTLTRVFFERFNVPSLLLVPDHLMALATLGSSTGLVLDIGAEEARSIAVIDGVTMLNETQFNTTGARELDRFIAHELIKTNQPIDPKLMTPKLVEDIRIKTCFVAPIERARQMTEFKVKQLQQPREKKKESAPTPASLEEFHLLAQLDDGQPASLQYPLGGQKSIVVPGNLREGACEILFEVFGYEHSLTTMIIETILSLPIDCRRVVAENILVIGGLANLPGLEKRLSDELTSINFSERFKRSLPPTFKFHKPICPRNYVSWLGASVFCTSFSLELRSTTREQWSRDGKKNLRDWCDLIR